MDRTWISVTQGAVSGQLPKCSVQYEHVGGDVLVSLVYELSGLWVRPGTCPSESILEIPGGRDYWELNLPRVPVDVFSIAVPRGAVLQTGAALDTSRVLGERCLDTAYILPTVSAEVDGIIPAGLVGESSADRGDWHPHFVMTRLPAHEVDGIHRFVAHVAPVVYHKPTRRVKVRERIEAEVRMTLAGNGRYGREIDWGSAIVRTMKGAAIMMRDWRR